MLTWYFTSSKSSRTRQQRWTAGLFWFYNAMIIFLLTIEWKDTCVTSAQLWHTFCGTTVLCRSRKVISRWLCQCNFRIDTKQAVTNDDFQESGRVVLRRGVSLLLARLRGLVLYLCTKTAATMVQLWLTAQTIDVPRCVCCVQVMCRYRNVWNVDLKLRPAFLGGIMQGSGAAVEQSLHFFSFIFNLKQRLSFVIPLFSWAKPSWTNIYNRTHVGCAKHSQTHIFIWLICTTCFICNACLVACCCCFS